MTYPLKPPLECDIVMKGGITSGVIYPRAVCELAKTYRLRSVGGSSAGAIAAAAAAAAELGRAAGGFEQLEALPDLLTDESPAGGSILFRLFQPSKAGYPLYRAVTAGMGKSAKGLRTVVALVLGFWLWALFGALFGIVVIVLGALGSGTARWAGIVAGAVLLFLGVVAGVGAGVAKVLSAVPRAGFGLCTGMPGRGGKGAKALTPWLHEQLQSMSGRQDPLTFGDLADKGIELQMMTTNLTRRHPTAMPWASGEYFFDPAEMRTLFPEDVVAAMERAYDDDDDADPSPTKEKRRRDLLRAHALPRLPFPPPDTVPVVVATRMSLSFPLLITAVPLYAVDYSDPSNWRARDDADAWIDANPAGTAKQGAASTPSPRFDVNWFSDGGICANLPVHFFDRPLPTRPTFAVDLAHFPPGRTKSADQSANCYLPDRNSAGRLRPWTRMPTSGLAALGAFFSQIVNTARGWVDAGQLSMPGYRDRVVTIYHDDAEGGMNLAMPKNVVTDLASCGQAAATKLQTQFAGPQPGVVPAPGWDNQRWIRFRTATAGLHAWLGAFQSTYSAEPAGASSYSEFAGANADASLPSYDLPASREVDRRAEVNARTVELLAMASTWGGDGSLLYNAPKPVPRLRLVPNDGIASGLTDSAGDEDSSEPEPSTSQSSTLVNPQ